MNTPIRHTLLLALVGVAASACADMYGSDHAMPAPATMHGSYLADASGMTLYTFDADPADASRSVCNGPCASNWPPLKASAEAHAGAPWSILKRDDGSLQYAYKGKPVYRWSKDMKPGDATGDGFKGVWHAVKP